MKKFFTLCVIVLASVFTNRSIAQLNENFENGLAYLEANCWQFTNMMYATNPSSYIISGNGSPYSEPPVSSDSVRIISTPFLWVENSIDISFLYRLSGNLNGMATRFIKIDLIDASGNIAQTLDSFSVTNAATSTSVYNQTFVANSQGAYRLSITIGGSTGGGNVRLSIDNLVTNAYLLGCFARTLPVHLMSFQGNMNKNNKVTLNWTVADNEIVNSFEVERSINGRDFTTVGLVFPSEKIGTENYMFYETVTSNDRVMYRLKMIDKGHEIDFSKTLIFNLRTGASNSIRIIGNPVADKLTFSYASSANQSVDIKVYDMIGKTIMKNKMTSLEGNNIVNLPLNSSIKPGMYIVEVNDGTRIQTTKFIKQ